MSSRTVAVLAALLFAFNLWGYDLWAPDEPYFGEGAREMIADGKWVVPHVNGVITTDKPPLFFWLIAALSLPAGHVTSLTARLPSLFAALGVLVLTMRLGAAAAGRATGALAGAVLATSYLFWDKARTAQIDATLCFFVTAAVSAFEAWRRGAWSGRRAGSLFWAATALAVLAKGPVGLLVPLGIAITTLAWDGRLRDAKGFAPIIGPLVFLAVAAIWPVLLWLWGDPGYSLAGAFRQHVLERAVRGMHHVQPPWYYAKVLPVQLFPWSALVPGAMLLGWRRRSDPWFRLAVVHALFVVAFFSIWTEKRDLYVLPAYPAFALLVARLAASVAGLGAADGEERPAGIWVTAPVAATGVLMMLLGPAAVVAARRLAPDAIGPAWVLGATLVIGGLAVVTIAWRRRIVGSVVALATAAAACYLVVSGGVNPALDPIKSARTLAQEVKEITRASRDAGERVLAFGVGNLPEAIAFYSDGVYMLEIDAMDELAEGVRDGRSRYAVMEATALTGLPPDLADRARIVARKRASRLEAVLVRFDPPGPSPPRGRSIPAPPLAGRDGRGMG